jgi:hypothetical protein
MPGKENKLYACKIYDLTEEDRVKNYNDISIQYNESSFKDTTFLLDYISSFISGKNIYSIFKLWNGHDLRHLVGTRGALEERQAHAILVKIVSALLLFLD